MNRVTKSLVAAAAVAGAAVGGITVAGAATSGTAPATIQTDATVEASAASEDSAEGYEAETETDEDTPITGDALTQATAAALAETGGGEVIETELEDGDAPYEVEVLLEDGSVLEVELDSDFQVVSVEADDDEAGDDYDDEEDDDEDMDEDGDDDDDEDDD